MGDGFDEECAEHVEDVRGGGQGFDVDGGHGLRFGWSTALLACAGAAVTCALRMAAWWRGCQSGFTGTTHCKGGDPPLASSGNGLRVRWQTSGQRNAVRSVLRTIARNAAMAIRSRVLRRWRGALLPDTASVTVRILERDKRPVAAVAGHVEFRGVAEVEIAMDHATKLVLLHDPGHSLDERILAEQFGA